MGVAKKVKDATKKLSGSAAKTGKDVANKSKVVAKKGKEAVKKTIASVTSKTPEAKVDAPAVINRSAPREKVWGYKLTQVSKVLEKRGFTTSIVSSLEDAKNVVMKDILPAIQPKTVSFGGSMTVLDAGLLDALLATKGLDVLNTFDFSIGLDAMIELRRQALLTDLFLCSANALTLDGTVMLLDGFGNRSAAVQFGPKNVVLLVGRNKICKDVEEGFWRVKNMAAPANAIRLNKKTPCTETGYCMDCNSPDRICSTWTLTNRSAPKGRIHVILIDAEVGF